VLPGLALPTAVCATTNTIVPRRAGEGGTRASCSAHERDDDQRPGERGRPSGDEERHPAGEQGRRGAVPQELVGEPCHGPNHGRVPASGHGALSSFASGVGCTSRSEARHRSVRRWARRRRDSQCAADGSPVWTRSGSSPPLATTAMTSSGRACRPHASAFGAPAPPSTAKPYGRERTDHRTARRTELRARRSGGAPSGRAPAAPPIDPDLPG
jgi:hypothetical protein